MRKFSSRFQYFTAGLCTLQNFELPLQHVIVSDYHYPLRKSRNALHSPDFHIMNSRAGNIDDILKNVLARIDYFS